MGLPGSVASSVSMETKNHFFRSCRVRGAWQFRSLCPSLTLVAASVSTYDCVDSGSSLTVRDDCSSQQLSLTVCFDALRGHRADRRHALAVSSACSGSSLPVRSFARLGSPASTVESACLGSGLSSRGWLEEVIASLLQLLSMGE